MQKFLPIFPLSLVAYPGEELNLHIFEPRYKQLITECAGENKTFGIPVVNKKEILEYGTEMQLKEIVKTYDNGELDIKVKGLHVFRILDIINEVTDKLYSGAVVAIINNVNDHHARTFNELEHRINELFTLLEIKETIFKKSLVFDSFHLAHLVGFEIMDEFELLKHPRETTRQKIILEHVKKMLPVVKQMAEIREKAKLNGHFRMVNPPEGL